MHYCKQSLGKILAGDFAVDFTGHGHQPIKGAEADPQGFACCMFAADLAYVDDVGGGETVRPFNAFSQILFAFDLSLKAETELAVL
ncbi:hypothetical protein ADUPG1_005627, partial [Aduncisulcus paluster]